jgi:hypothetical protein
MARAEQIYIPNRRYVTNTPPLLPSSLLHGISPLAHHPPPGFSTCIRSVTCVGKKKRQILK